VQFLVAQLRGDGLAYLLPQLFVPTDQRMVDRSVEGELGLDILFAARRAKHGDQQKDVFLELFFGGHGS
jgi:hypothetical protein